jgi:hypothetical protein
MARTLKITNGDIVKYLGSTYSYQLLSGREKVTQDIKMVLTTSVRASTGLGCGLDDVIGQDTMNSVSSFTQFPAVFDFQNRVRVGLERLSTAQKNYLYGQRSNDEIIKDISAVRIWPASSDLRNYRWRVDVLTIKGKEGISITGQVQ